jgi:hypothetical protein
MMISIAAWGWELFSSYPNESSLVVARLLVRRPPQMLCAAAIATLAQ